MTEIFNLSDYLVAELIDENNQLTVYRGKSVQKQSSVIIKTLKPGAGTADIAKLINEYEITRNLDISGIIKPVRLEWTDLTVALVFDDTGDLPLKKYLQANRPDLLFFFSIAIQLTITLGELHHHGIVHRDLKPGAIFIQPDTGQIRITDFGIAASQKDQIETMSKAPAGTPAYMSPEQIGRTGRKIDHRSDFYSLGVVFYEILTRRLPLHAGNNLQWTHAHIAQKPINVREINPDIPPAIDTIVMKLLAKTAGERYQSAAGLLADLEECRRQWSQNEEIELFIPGMLDSFNDFHLPRTLYGREKEIVVIQAAFESVFHGQSGLLLIHGYAGTGKTALVTQTLRTLTMEKGHFITGKFDQLQQNIPYLPFIQAFRELIRQLLTESRENLIAWKSTLLSALGRNAAVITEVIPEVELITGPQPPVERLRPREAQNRFRIVFRNFINAFTQKECPLVFFIDDLQWADPASLTLLQHICADHNSHYLLLISAYRDNETTGNHPLQHVLEELPKAAIPLQHISLAPLEMPHTNQFIADALHISLEHSQPLAEIFHRKTGGNPFFLSQLLQSACAENFLHFNDKTGCLEWSPDSISKMPIDDDIINFMLGKLQKLPAETLKVLQLAACIGNTFNLCTLAIACEQTTVQTSTDLRPLITEGLILPINCTGKSQQAFRYSTEYAPIADCSTRYEFLHDRVQQASYALVPEENKRHIHLQIGRLILQYTAQNELEEKIFNIMDHLNRGLNYISDPAEKIRLAEYNLLAGKKAKTAIAYGSALNYFKYGLELLPRNSWDEHYALTYDLYMERSQCECLCANVETAEQLFDLLLTKTRTDLEKADIYITKIILTSSIERYHETLQLGKKALKLLGVNLPVNPGKFAFIKEFLLAKWRLRNRKSEDCTVLPEMTDPVQKRVMLLLLVQAGAACVTNPELYALINLKISNLSFKFGNTEFTSIGYAGYSFFTGSVLGDYKTGHEFEKAALKLVEKYDNSSACILYFMLGAFVSHWTSHGQISINYLKKAVDYGVETGNLLVVGYASTLLIETKYHLGFSLAELYEECQSYYKIAKRQKLLNYQLLIENLLNLSANGFNLSNNATENNFNNAMKDKNTILTGNFPKMQLFYLYGDHRSALAVAEQAQQNINGARGLLISAEYIFYYSLAITACYDKLAVKETKKYRKILQKNQKQLKKWSNFCPANFLHKYLLVTAEIARLDGNDSEAMTLYDRSIQSACENGFGQNEALSNELAARFYLTKSRDKVAKAYLADACHGYHKWGAARKVQCLKTKYPHLLTVAAIEKEDAAAIEIFKQAYHFSGAGNSESSAQIELDTIRQAVQKFANETDPAKLLENFLNIAIENAGAEKGYLILEKDENLLIEVVKERDMHAALVITPLPLEKSMNLSQMIVRYVARTLEPIVINDAGQAGIFARDPYIAQSSSQSIVCMPLTLQNIPVGILYLENSLLTGVFTPDRLKVLKLLASQIAYVQKLQSFLEAENNKEPTMAAIPLIEPLTERELEVLRLIAAGMSNKEIALNLQLTVNTIKTHILNIYGKLQVNRRVQAIAKAKELNLLK